MPSAVTQNIGSAVAATVSSTNLVQQQGQVRPSAPNQALPQLHQNIQAAAQLTAVKPRANDKDRAPQIPKRVEPTYTAHAKKKTVAKQAPEEDREEQAAPDLNLVA